MGSTAAQLDPSIESEVRAGPAGLWDRFVGPGTSAVERAGTFGLLAAGLLRGDRALPPGASGMRRLSMRLLAADLWGGAWVNNTRSCVRWYERPGQGPKEHLAFASLHVLHPALIASEDVVGGRRGRAAAARWALGHFALMLASAALIAVAPRRQRLTRAAVAAGAGTALDRLVGPSPAAPWFVPVFYTKLLIGHAAGSIWARGG